MTARHRAMAELTVALAAVVATAASWLHTRSTVVVGPVADGQPVTVSVVYHPQLLVLTLLLATVAGIFAVVGAARLRRSARPSAGAEPTAKPSS
ncbi:hypothetical protein PJK45_12840 [Mycobacterium kansasii]|uniref:Transmembrane protein n=3 Tax=Mycobacterium kansasii TaxID=1768 RepID=A0A1V3WPB3_MYCKA|nr:hypothetical protein [Mycobacterium kansasii]EUA04389.1 hypothetical protein I547_1741 [Mycobacterium kansasii 824]AGZ52056.1 membrane protein [Mycobacterium kansasii ATCC 12478]ARG56249.1 hypothetical protein B1T43_10670 [Mycobacterium kansasii]ARG61695.1 hypothetical protein B1T45_10735 [Mycobacterium kansasii]ARG69382.1 hypothetical protein B1T47_10370 [Mycobacterium kansasii]